MARATLVKPDTDQIAGADGKLTREWEDYLIGVDSYLNEQQNTPAEESGLTEGQVQTIVDAAIATAVAGLPAVTYYEETFSPSGGFKQIDHNLGTRTPLWSVSQEINSAVIFALDIGDENTSYLNFNANPSQPITITMARIVMPE